ncbi:uncharacterized protein N7473_004807 [Penicillium subrubescens]|jgi:hypothetical protein|uniref:uncharacterized protein n=1 Tax=Penicillium subrubescens TaxID=1316194 RepID=UPI0025450C57|nr:uncharacterized protein N7473_004807 [Penicillium subrubescens]KAJ5900737.1 hypothetical protein N7473_004807 [Penicillium subrubescens]
MEEGTISGLPSELPPLPYSLHTRKKAIAIFWTIFVIDTLGQPVILYWTLWYCTDLSHNLVFSIVTACLGGVSVFEYFYRLYHLRRKSSRARPLNAKASWLDFFHINFTIVWLILAVELIVGTVPTEPYVRLVAMVLPTVMFYFGFVHLTLDVLRMMGYKAPFRISSTPKGSVMPTALYALIEDVVAVDGGGGQMYRYALRTRYLSSPYFRKMLFEMNCFWSGGSIIFAAVFTAIIFTVSEPVAFTLGWTLPFAWAGVWTLITIPWVQSDLRREKQAWAENRGQGGIRYVDDIAAPTARTRFASVQEALPNLLPWVREKQALPSAPFAEGAVGTGHKAESVPDSTPAVSEGNSPGPASTTLDAGDETTRHSKEIHDGAAPEPVSTSAVDEKN